MADENMTLLEAAKLLPASPSTGAIGTFAEAYQPMQVAPVIASSMHYNWTDEDELAHDSSTIGTRNINADFDSTQGRVAPYSTQLKIYGGKIKADRYIKTLAPESVRFQQMSQIKSFAKKFSTDLFEGAGGTYLRGWKDWIDNDSRFANQLVNAGNTASGVLLTTAMMDDLLSSVDVIDGQTFIYCSNIASRRYKYITKGQAANEPRIVYTPEQAGIWPGGSGHNRSGVVATYEGIPIVNMKDGKGTDLLSITELDGASTNSDTSSMYVVVYGTEMASIVAGGSSTIAANGVPVPMITLENSDNYGVESLEWYASNVPHSIRSIARLKNIKQGVS